MHDDLARWEKWPVAALFVAQGLQVFEWYVAARMPPEVAAALPWLVTAAGLAAFAAIDGAMIATVMGMRAGRRSRWSVAAIVLTAGFGAAVALDLHGALAVGAWLHAGFALTIAAYLLHLAQPRATSANLHEQLAAVRAELAAAHATLAGERARPVLDAATLARLVVKAGAPEATVRGWVESGRLLPVEVETT